MRGTTTGTLMAAALGATTLTALPDAARAQDYDMDCGVILCMAGGFPDGCEAPYAYMINRLTARPPKPPFGHCPMSDDRGYGDHEVAYSRPTGRAAYRCPDGSRLRYDVTRAREEGTRREVFCYTHATRREVRCGRDCETTEVAYHGRSPARRITYSVRLTLAPVTETEWRSALIEGNWRTGEVWQTGGDLDAPATLPTPVLAPTGGDPAALE